MNFTVFCSYSLCFSWDLCRYWTLHVSFSGFSLLLNTFYSFHTVLSATEPPWLFWNHFNKWWKWKRGPLSLS